MPARREVIRDVEGRGVAQPRQRHVRRELAGLRRQADPAQQPLLLRLQLEDLGRWRTTRAKTARGFAAAEGVEAVDGDAERLAPASFAEHRIDVARHARRRCRR